MKMQCEIRNLTLSDYPIFDKITVMEYLKFTYSGTLDVGSGVAGFGNLRKNKFAFVNFAL